MARMFQNTKGARMLRTFFESENQDQILADLETFFGPRSNVYLAMYEKLRSSSNHWAFSFSWPVFLGAFVWFFYRKMYI
jgi:hypothetical protein